MQLDIGAHDFEKGVKQPIRFDIEVMVEAVSYTHLTLPTTR